MSTTWEERVRLMETVGPGGRCVIDGRPVILVEFDEIARVYRFEGRSGQFSVSDEWFSKNLGTIGPHES